MERMKAGLEKLLMLHNPVELSSISGTLGLKVQQKGPTSIKNIVDYARDGNIISEEKVSKIFGCMWEGGVFYSLSNVHQ